ncbi:cationic amino acid transporter 4, vacuolar [Brassica napus]|nr:cationic amino acid transporter 4, vacuolar [Brassica napus]
MPSSSSKRIFVLTKNKRPNKEYLWIFVFLSENIFGLKSSKKITKFYLTFFRNLCFLPFSQKVRIVHASQSISYTSSGLRHLFKEIIKVLTFVFWKFKSFADMNENGGSSKKCSWGFNSLVRRKQVDSAHLKNDHGHHQLAKKLTAFDLVAIGVGTTIGAGVYILVGTVAREHTGPALAVSFFIAGVAAALSACCYAELASRCPSAGSAYHYAYICLGEGIAWLVGWALVLDYTIGGSAIARGISPNLASFFGGLDKLPVFLARQTIPGLGIVVDPCAALLIMIVTILLCFGIKESSLVQAIVTSVNVCTLVFIIVVGGYTAFKTGWVGYDLSSGFFPFGLKGILAGAAVVFFSYIGFDTVTSTAEEVKNPQRDLPLGIGIALLICCILYMLLSVVIVGLVPYYTLDPDTPISSAFGDSGMQWAAYILTTGAITALCASLLGSLLAQPRIFMAMARDGLLPAFFAEIDPRTQVPVKNTIVIGVLAASLAFFMDVSQLSEMVSVGTLMAFTSVAVCVLVLRYVPPYGVPLPSSSQTWTDADESRLQTERFLVDATESSDSPLLGVKTARDEKYFGKRRKIAAWSIVLVCIGVLGLSSAASAERLPSFPRFTMCGVSAAILLGSLITLCCIDEDDERHNFGHQGGFLCPFVPYLPVLCILINTYLIINIGVGTWIRVLIWLLVGSMIYLFYGRSHSLLNNADYVPTTCTEKTTDHHP